jgi:hypothetical protein
MTIPNKFYFNHQFKQDNNIPCYNATSSEKIPAGIYGHVRVQNNLWVALGLEATCGVSAVFICRLKQELLYEEEKIH